MLRRLLFLLVVCALPTTLNAAVVDYSLVKLTLYSQTADNTAPTVAAGAEFFGQLAVDDPTDFTDVTLTGLGAPGAPLVFAKFFGGFDWEGSAAFATQAAMDAQFPNLTYELNATGPLGNFSEQITVSGTHPHIPFFTGTVFSDASTLDPTKPFTFTWNAPSAGGFFFSIEEVGGPEIVFINGLGKSDTSATVSANTFASGKTYQAVLTFGNVQNDTRDSFTTGDGLIGFGSETDFTFTVGSGGVVPEPSSIACWISLALALAAFNTMRMRQRSLQLT